MTVNEILTKVSEHQIKGLMLHKNMSKAYDHLGIRSFKRIHEYQEVSENAENLCLDRYADNHTNMMLRTNDIASPFDVPMQFYNTSRLQVTNGDRQKFHKAMFDAWHAWEVDTKKLYSWAYNKLCSLSKDVDDYKQYDRDGVATAKTKIGYLLECVDNELKDCERKYIIMSQLNWDIPLFITRYDDEWHDEYHEKTKKIGVDIC